MLNPTTQNLYNNFCPFTGSRLRFCVVAESIKSTSLFGAYFFIPTTMNKNYDYEYYLKLSRPDGESFNASILSQVNLRGLVFP